MPYKDPEQAKKRHKAYNAKRYATEEGKAYFRERARRERYSGKRRIREAAYRAAHPEKIAQWRKSNTPERQAYRMARFRCRRLPNSWYFKNWAARGVKFLFKTYDEWFAALGPRPSPKHSVDRWPNRDGNYEPGNVRWATPTQQIRNSRVTHLTEDKVKWAKQQLAAGRTGNSLAKELGVSRAQIYRIRDGKQWKDILP